MDFTSARPTSRESLMLLMPLTMVQNTIGAIIILTSLTKPSPKGFSAAPNSGQKWPVKTPSMRPISTWT
ncbi:hypothetical protein ACVIW3_002400 [Bradyrhizobium diazoefficiens]